MMANYECVIRLDGDGYVTGTIKGQRAACTWSEDEAARRLGTKLLGDKLSHVERQALRIGDIEKRIYSRWLIVEKEA